MIDAYSVVENSFQRVKDSGIAGWRRNHNQSRIINLKMDHEVVKDARPRTQPPQQQNTIPRSALVAKMAGEWRVVVAMYVDAVVALTQGEARVPFDSYGKPRISKHKTQKNLVNPTLWVQRIPGTRERILRIRW